MGLFQIDDVLVSLDIAERYFCCDLDKCHGMCCIDGDDGAPVTEEEEKIIRELMPQLEPEMTESAKKVASEQGLTYRDVDNDLVLQTVEDANCIFTTMAPGGKCLCCIDALCRQGKTHGFSKPISCALYPIRVTKLSSGLDALNYERRKLCRSAEKNGREKNIHVYQFLEGPLTRLYGKEWYATLRDVCDRWNKEHERQ